MILSIYLVLEANTSFPPLNDSIKVSHLVAFDIVEAPILPTL